MKTGSLKYGKQLKERPSGQKPKLLIPENIISERQTAWKGLNVIPKKKKVLQFWKEMVYHL